MDLASGLEFSVELIAGDNSASSTIEISSRIDVSIIIRRCHHYLIRRERHLKLAPPFQAGLAPSLLKHRGIAPGRFRLFVEQRRRDLFLIPLRQFSRRLRRSQPAPRIACRASVLHLDLARPDLRGLTRVCASARAPPRTRAPLRARGGSEMNGCVGDFAVGPTPPPRPSAPHSPGSGRSVWRRRAPCRRGPSGSWRSRPCGARRSRRRW